MTDTHDSTTAIDDTALTVPAGKIEEVMDWVTAAELPGESARRAQAALAVEIAATAPRQRLMKKLQEIILPSPGPSDVPAVPDPASDRAKPETALATGVELPATIRWWGEPLIIVDEEENTTALNERGVELAVVGEFLGAVADLIEDDGRSPHDSSLEVGGVLGAYVDETPWAVVESLGALVEASGDRDWIVAISIAHHLPVPDVDSAVAVIELLRSKLTTEGKLIVTAPLGYHEAWDQLILVRGSGAVRECTFVRDDDGRWVQTEEIEFRPYGATNPWADAVWIAEFECAS